MHIFYRKLRAFVADQSGPTPVEYGVMIALIMMVGIFAATSLSTKANATFENVTHSADPKIEYKAN